MGAMHPVSLLASLNEATALGWLGRLVEARAKVKRALAPLRESCGDDAPIYRRALTLNARLSVAESDGFEVHNFPHSRVAEPTSSNRPGSGFFL